MPPPSSSSSSSSLPLSNVVGGIADEKRGGGEGQESRIPSAEPRQFLFQLKQNLRDLGKMRFSQFQSIWDECGLGLLMLMPKLSKGPPGLIKSNNYIGEDCSHIHDLYETAVNTLRHSIRSGLSGHLAIYSQIFGVYSLFILYNSHVPIKGVSDGRIQIPLPDSLWETVTKLLDTLKSLPNKDPEMILSWLVYKAFDFTAHYPRPVDYKDQNFGLVMQDDGQNLAFLSGIEHDLYHTENKAKNIVYPGINEMAALVREKKNYLTSLGHGPDSLYLSEMDTLTDATVRNLASYREGQERDTRRADSRGGSHADVDLENIQKSAGLIDFAINGTDFSQHFPPPSSSSLSSSSLVREKFDVYLLTYLANVRREYQEACENLEPGALPPISGIDVAQKLHPGKDIEVEDLLPPPGPKRDGLLRLHRHAVLQAHEDEEEEEKKNTKQPSLMKSPSSKKTTATTPKAAARGSTTKKKKQRSSANSKRGSGIPGVHKCKRKYMVRFSSDEYVTEKKCRSFSVNRYGEEMARFFAIECKRRMDEWKGDEDEDPSLVTISELQKSYEKEHKGNNEKASSPTGEKPFPDTLSAPEQLPPHAPPQPPSDNTPPEDDSYRSSSIGPTPVPQAVPMECLPNGFKMPPPRPPGSSTTEAATTTASSSTSSSSLRDDADSDSQHSLPIPPISLDGAVTGSASAVSNNSNMAEKKENAAQKRRRGRMKPSPSKRKKMSRPTPSKKKKKQRRSRDGKNTRSSDDTQDYELLMAELQAHLE